MSSRPAAAAVLLAALPGTLSLLLGRGGVEGELVAADGRHSAVGTRSANATLELLSSFRVCSANCRRPEDFRRYGEDRDGGYQLCEKTGRMPEVAYSLGVGSHDKWSWHVASRLGVRVHQFDCFRVKSAAVCKNCTLHRECVSNAEGVQRLRAGHHDARTFEEMLRATNRSSAARGSLLLKMDIEGDEWKILPAVAAKDLQRFGQIVVEFHRLSDEERHPEYLAGLQQLRNAGFKVAHLHGNNQDPMFEVGRYRIPEVLEVTFVLEPGEASDCLSHVEDFPFEPLNAPTLGSLPSTELPDAGALAAI